MRRNDPALLSFRGGGGGRRGFSPCGIGGIGPLGGALRKGGGRAESRVESVLRRDSILPRVPSTGLMLAFPPMAGLALPSIGREVVETLESDREPPDACLE